MDRTLDQLRKLLDQATQRVLRRKDAAFAAGTPIWTDPLFEEAAFLQDRLRIIWSAAACAPAERGIRESQRLATQDGISGRIGL